MPLGKKFSALVAVTVVMLSVLCFMPTQGAQGQISPTSVELTVTPETGYIDMTTNGSVFFSGQISVTTLPIVVTTINISVWSGDWINDTDQTNFVITGNRASEFEVGVYAPFDSLAGDSETVIITATWTTSLNEAGSEEKRVEAVVEQYYRINAYSPTTLMSSEPDNTFEWRSKIYINNNGNGDDQATIKMTNVSNLVSNGWSFDLDKTTINLEPNGQGQSTLTISVPSNAALKTYRFYVNVTSEGSKDVGLDMSDETTLTLIVKKKVDNGNGNGGNGNGDNGDEPNNICSTEYIPLMIMAPLGVTMFGVKRYKRTKER